jgi:hypothetical protein
MMKVIIVLNEYRSQDMTETIRRLRRAGLIVHRTLPGIHMVTGSIDEAKLASLRALNEVLAVEKDEIVHPTADQ